MLNDYRLFKEAAQDTPFANFAAGLGGYLLATAVKSAPGLVFDKTPLVTVVNRGGPAHRALHDGSAGAAIANGAVLYRGPFVFCGAGTCPDYGFGFKIFPFAGIRPGQMNVRITTAGAGEMALHLPQIWTGVYRTPRIHDFYADRVSFEFDGPVPFQIGGDALGTRTKVEFGISDDAYDFVDLRRPKLLAA